MGHKREYDGKTPCRRGLTLTYDDADRLKTVEQGGAVVLENTYDAFGNRVRKVEGDRQTIYMYDGNNVVYEWEADIEGVTTPTDATETFHVFVGNLRVARIVDGDLQLLITDHLGSTRVITDHTGNLLHRLDYRPFGEELTSSGTDGAKFTGKTEDGIGLYYYGARFYDPTIGRFLTVDPARDGLNWYAYTRNNPLRYVDPDGREIRLAKHLSKKDKELYDLTIAYLRQSEDFAALMDRLENDSRIVTINIGTHLKSDFDARSKCFMLICWDPNPVVNWNPTQAVSIESVEKESGEEKSLIRSAAIGLAHEFGHVAQFWDGEVNWGIASNGMFKGYRSRMENRNLDKYENPIALQLGEHTRSDYSIGKKVYTTGPLSLELKLDNLKK